MIKSWGGDGYVKNALFQNFLARGTAYGLGALEPHKKMIIVIDLRTFRYQPVLVIADRGGRGWRATEQYHFLGRKLHRRSTEFFLTIMR